MYRPTLCLVAAALLFAGCRNSTSHYDPQPEAWATTAECDGIGKLPVFKVDETLYRGAQPSAKQFAAIRAMGVKTVVDLRESNTEERAIVGGLGMKYVSIPMTASNANEGHIIEFLKVMSDPANHPVYLHCRLGADRSGMMHAVYRVVVLGWEKDEALREYTKGGYNFHPLCTGLVHLVRTCDVSRLRGLSGVRFSDSRSETAARGD